MMTGSSIIGDSTLVWSNRTTTNGVVELVQQQQQQQQQHIKKEEETETKEEDWDGDEEEEEVDAVVENNHACDSDDNDDDDDTTRSENHDDGIHTLQQFKMEEEENSDQNNECGDYDDWVMVDVVGDDKAYTNNTNNSKRNALLLDDNHYCHNIKPVKKKLKKVVPNDTPVPVSLSLSTPRTGSGTETETETGPSCSSIRGSTIVTTDAAVASNDDDDDDDEFDSSDDEAVVKRWHQKIKIMHQSSSSTSSDSYNYDDNRKPPPPTKKTKKGETEVGNSTATMKTGPTTTIIAGSSIKRKQVVVNSNSASERRSRSRSINHLRDRDHSSRDHSFADNGGTDDYHSPADSSFDDNEGTGDGDDDDNDDKTSNTITTHTRSTRVLRSSHRLRIKGAYSDHRDDIDKRNDNNDENNDDDDNDDDDDDEILIDNIDDDDDDDDDDGNKKLPRSPPPLKETKQGHTEVGRSRTTMKANSNNDDSDDGYSGDKGYESWTEGSWCLLLPNNNNTPVTKNYKSKRHIQTTTKNNFLKGIPVYTSKQNEQWNTMFTRLVAYKEQHKTANVPKRYKEDLQLGEWVSTQRQKYTKEIISKDRMDLLDSIGFVFDLRSSTDDAKWMEMYQRLVAYKKHHKNTFVPRRYKEDQNLGRWVDTQRQCYKNKKLSIEQINYLEPIGFVWKVRDREWIDMYDRLVAYKQRNQSTQVPTIYTEDPRLGNWVHYQRQKYNKDKLMARQVELLNSVDFVWCAK